MSSDPEKTWKSLAARIRRAKMLHKLSPAEAEAELRDAPDMPLSEGEIDAVIRGATSGKLDAWEPEPSPECLEDINTASVDEGVLQLNRNPGENDPETEKLIEELRRSALEGNEPDKEPEQNDVDGDGTPPGDGK